MGKCCYTSQGEKFGQVDINQNTRSRIVTQYSGNLPCLEYFIGGLGGQVSHGRAMSIRMLLWYTGVAYKDMKITPDEFAKKKMEDAYTFG